MLVIKNGRETIPGISGLPVAIFWVDYLLVPRSVHVTSLLNRIRSDNVTKTENLAADENNVISQSADDFDPSGGRRFQHNFSRQNVCKIIN